jgi:hypothetical protein
MSTYITILTYRILEDTLGMPGQILPAVKAMELFEVVILTVLYMTTTVLTWWFADRRTAKFLGKMLGSRGLA